MRYSKENYLNGLCCEYAWAYGQINSKRVFVIESRDGGIYHAFVESGEFFIDAEEKKKTLDEIRIQFIEDKEYGFVREIFVIEDFEKHGAKFVLEAYNQILEGMKK